MFTKVPLIEFWLFPAAPPVIPVTTGADQE